MKIKNENTYYLGDTSLPTRKTKIEGDADTLLQYADEMQKCKNDIMYFAENYFYITNPDEGKIKIKLHNYQKRFLKLIKNNRFVIFNTSRQSGKALSLDTPILTDNGWSNMGNLKIGDKIYDENGKLCNITYLHPIEYNRPCYRIIFDNDEEIIADEQHEWFTQNKNEYYRGIEGSIKTTLDIYNTLKSDGLNHRIKKSNKIEHIDYHQSQINIEYFRIGDDKIDYIYIKDVIPVESVPVRCITVNSPNHLFLAGKTLIPTHNSTILTIYALWYVLNNKDKTVLLIANKEDTAIEIFGRIKTAYKELPNWLKSGVGKFDQTKLELVNGSRIIVSTTTGSAARGYTINLLLLDEFAFVECVDYDTQISIKNKYTGFITHVSIGELFDKLEGDKSENNDEQIIAINDQYEINTPNGWKDFKGVRSSKSNKCIKLIFDDESYIITSSNHLLKDIDGNFIESNSALNHTFIKKDKLIVCKKIEKVGTKILYDIFDIQDNDHVYYTNDLISHNCHLAEEFFKSVYPTISASKSSKIVITSTPNGDNNIFYRLFKGAEAGTNGWKCDSVIWSDIPGRDQKWKEITLKTLGSASDFAQEFEAAFISDKKGFVNEDVIQLLKFNMNDPLYTFEDGCYNIYEEPKDSHIYVAGIDTSEGVGLDASVINIFDITNLQDIRQVACYWNNTILVPNFTTKCYEILSHWGFPIALIERNGPGSGVVDTLKTKYGYEHIVNYGASAKRIRSDIQYGIISNQATKNAAITNMRYLLTESQVITINDPLLLEEFKTFVRSVNGTWAAQKGSQYHDDRVMSMCWALFIIHKDIIKDYFILEKTDKHGVASRILKQPDIEYFIHNDNTNKFEHNNIPALPVDFNNGVMAPQYDVNWDWLNYT